MAKIITGTQNIAANLFRVVGRCFVLVLIFSDLSHADTLLAFDEISNFSGRSSNVPQLARIKCSSCSSDRQLVEKSSSLGSAAVMIANRQLRILSKEQGNHFVSLASLIRSKQVSPAVTPSDPNAIALDVSYFDGLRGPISFRFEINTWSNGATSKYFYATEIASPILNGSLIIPLKYFRGLNTSAPIKVKAITIVALTVNNKTSRGFDITLDSMRTCRNVTVGGTGNCYESGATTADVRSRKQIVLSPMVVSAEPTPSPSASPAPSAASNSGQLLGADSSNLAKGERVEGCDWAELEVPDEAIQRDGQPCSDETGTECKKVQPGLWELQCIKREASIGNNGIVRSESYSWLIVCNPNQVEYMAPGIGCTTALGEPGSCDGSGNCVRNIPRPSSQCNRTGDPACGPLDISEAGKGRRCCKFMPEPEDFEGDPNGQNAFNVSSQVGDKEFLGLATYMRCMTPEEAVFGEKGLGIHKSVGCAYPPPLEGVECRSWGLDDFDTSIGIQLWYANCHCGWHNSNEGYACGEMTKENGDQVACFHHRCSKGECVAGTPDFDKSGGKYTSAMCRD